MNKKLVILLALTILCKPITITSRSSSITIPFSPSHQANKLKKASMAEQEISEKDLFRWFRTFSEVVHLISKKHYKKVDIPTFIQNALKAAVPKTDPHSSFFSQESYKAVMESTAGKFSGIGVSILNKSPEDDSLIVIDVIQGGPSAKAGLMPGDKIIAVNGEVLKGLSADEVINKLRGKTGSMVTIKVIRKKKALEFSIKRAVIKDQNLMTYNFKKQKVYYISLKLFADNTPRQMGKILQKIEHSSYNGMIIDLRRNPGGVLESAVDMAGHFIKKGSLVASTRDRFSNTVTKYHTTANPIVKKKKPIFLLIDNFTASASEIFSGTLKHYSMQNDNLLVFLVGTETYGKGSVQTVFPISNGCALKLTNMTYMLPNETEIQAKGIKADLFIKPKSEAKKTAWFNDLYGKETTLKNHIPAQSTTKEEKKKATAAAKTEPSKEEMAKNWEERYRTAINEDSQIQACINMIGMLRLAGKHKPAKVSSRKSALTFLKKHYITDEKAEIEKL